MAVSSTRFRNRPEPASCARGASLCAAVAPVEALAEALVEALVEASAPEGAAVPWGYVPPFGTTSCPYSGPWHIHVPLGTYPQGTASFRELECGGFDRKSAAGATRCRHCRAVEPPAVFRLPSSVGARSHWTVMCHAGQPGDRSAAPNAPKDVVLPHWGSSGTWMCRARELRQDADVSDDPQCGRTAAPPGADDAPQALEADNGPSNLRNKKPRLSAGSGASGCGDLPPQSSGVMLDACAPFGPWVTS